MNAINTTIIDEAISDRKQLERLQGRLQNPSELKKLARAVVELAWGSGETATQALLTPVLLPAFRILATTQGPEPNADMVKVFWRELLALEGKLGG